MEIRDSIFRLFALFFGKKRTVCANGKHDSGMKVITSEFCLPFSMTGLPM